MSITRKKIVLSGMVLLIVGLIYYAKDPIQVLLMQRSGVSNYKSNVHLFEQLEFDDESLVFYDITKLNNDSIYARFTNVDINFLDSLRSLDTGEHFEYMETIQGFDPNKIDLSSLSCLFNGQLVIGNFSSRRWSITYRGSKDSEQFSQLANGLNLDSSNIQNQLSILEKANCIDISVHKEGIDMSYDKKITLQTGCILSTYCPIKYNFGNKFWIRKGDFPIKTLDANVHCYIDIGAHLVD